MRIILHIGQSKTGTTAIQNFLKENRSYLLKNKILYPDVFLNGLGVDMLNHNPFSDSINNFLYHPRLSADEYWAQFIEQANKHDCDTMIISGESFFRGRPGIWEVAGIDEYIDVYTKKLNKLKSLFLGHDVEVVVYLREQMKWLQSAVAHIIRYEGTMQRTVYQSDEQIVQLLMPLLNYYHFIQLWDKTINPKKIMISEYERGSLLNKNIIDDFLDKINVPVEKKNFQISKKEVHESWSREFVEIKKEINKTKKSRVKEDTIISLIDALNKKVGSGKKYQIESDVYKKAVLGFEETNKELAKNYNNGIDVFSTKNNANLYSYEQASKDEVEMAMRNFNKALYSIRGVSAYTYSFLKRFLKKRSPYLFSLCTKIKKRCSF